MVSSYAVFEVSSRWCFSFLCVFVCLIISTAQFQLNTDWIFFLMSWMKFFNSSQLDEVLSTIVEKIKPKHVWIWSRAASIAIPNYIKPISWWTICSLENDMLEYPKNRKSWMLFFQGPLSQITRWVIKFVWKESWDLSLSTWPTRSKHEGSCDIQRKESKTHSRLGPPFCVSDL